MKRKFKRDLTSLEKIFSSIGEFITHNRIDESIVFTINLVVEELFTNMIKYTQSTQEILICLQLKKSHLIISITDFDVNAFDITKSGQVDINRRLEERKPGGLGLHLVKEMVDDIQYEYKNRNSKITLIKNLE
jgi:anti-sigma regulatory factor (Ser/Thr protein kinase)